MPELDDRLAAGARALLEMSRDPAQVAGLAGWVLCLVAAWAIDRAVRRAILPGLAGSGSALRSLAQASVERLMRPAIVALVAGAGVLVLQRLGWSTVLLGVTATLAGALFAIRAAIHGLTLAFKPGPTLAAFVHLITWAGWALVALMVLGWLPSVASGLDAIAITVSGKRFSLLDASRTVLTVLVFVLAAAYASGVLERRLMAAPQVPIGVKIGVSKAGRFLLIILSILLAFNVMGVDLGGFTVFSGALGVGIGFGLQRIASNFVSGFILIGDRSIRPGDVITIDDRFGVVRELRARYVVVRDRDGVDTLIPNENVITSQVINWSYADRGIRLKVPLQISYQDDPRRAMALMVEAARGHPRIERSPEPAGRVMGFGESGIDLELRFWIINPEDGVNNVRSDLYLLIWDAFREAGITIPYPQRDVHIQAAGAAPD